MNTNNKKEISMNELAELVKSNSKLIMVNSKLIQESIASIDDLARTTATGFENTVTKAEFRNEVSRLDSQLNDINRFIRNHEKRIDNTEDDIRVIQTSFQKDLKIKLI